MAAAEAFPCPGPAQRRVIEDHAEEKVVRIKEDDLAPVRCRGIGYVGLPPVIIEGGIGPRRDPVGGTGEQLGVIVHIIKRRHPHRVLLRFALFAGVDEVDQMVLPLPGLPPGLVGDLAEHIVEIVDGVDHLPDIRLLEFENGRRDQGEIMSLETAAITVGVAIDSIDVVAGVEGVPLPFLALRVAAEKHDADIDASLAGGNDPRSEAIEICLLELLEVELRLAIEGSPRAGPAPGQGSPVE